MWKVLPQTFIYLIFPTKFKSPFTISAHNIYLLSFLPLLSCYAVESPASEPDYLALLPFTNYVMTYGRQLILFVPQVPYVENLSYNYMDFILSKHLYKVDGFSHVGF